MTSGTGVPAEHFSFQLHVFLVRCFGIYFNKFLLILENDAINSPNLGNLGMILCF